MTRISRFGLLLGIAVCLLLSSSEGRGQGKKGKKTGPALKGTEVFKVDDKLAAGDPKDKIRKSCHHKVHMVDLVAGAYIIDLVSDDFDPYLRIEDAKGNQIAKDDDKGGDFNSRLMFKVDQADSFRLVVTTYSRGETGKYKLSVSKEKDDKTKK